MRNEGSWFMKIFRRRPRHSNLVPPSVSSNGQPSNLVPGLGTEEAVLIHRLDQIVHISLVETLPAELKLQVLASLSLKNELGITIIDAIAVFQAENTFVKSTSACNLDKKDIQKFVKQYRALHYSEECSIDLTEKEAIAVTHFYVSFVKPFVARYAAWALTNVTQDPPPLSRTEENRIVRALYRFQLSCILFGYGPNNVLLVEANDESEKWRILAFLRIFEPWEIEEVSCIFAFANAIYCDVFERITWDLHRDNPKFESQGRGPTPEGAFDLKYFWDAYLSCVMSNGLSLLYTVSTIKDHQTLVLTMQENLRLVIGYFFGIRYDEVITRSLQREERAKYYSKGYRKQDHRDPFPFKGDYLPNMDQKYPPLAWTMLWNETYSTLIGHFIPEELRKWGYVMWDSATLEHIGGKVLLMQQWRIYWKDQDPRVLV